MHSRPISSLAPANHKQQPTSTILSIRIPQLTPPITAHRVA